MAITAEGARGSGEPNAAVAYKHGKKWVKGNPDNIFGQAIMQVLRKFWYIRDQLGHRVYSNSE